jgi:hypothetical protein
MNLPDFSLTGKVALVIGARRGIFHPLDHAGCATQPDMKNLKSTASITPP